MLKRWMDAGDLPASAGNADRCSCGPAPDDFAFVLIGPGGTGKTSVLRAAEALIECNPNAVKNCVRLRKPSPFPCSVKRLRLCSGCVPIAVFG